MWGLALCKKQRPGTYVCTSLHIEASVITARAYDTLIIGPGSHLEKTEQHVETMLCMEVGVAVLEEVEPGLHCSAFGTLYS